MLDENIEQAAKCPICQHFYSPDRINSHVNACLDGDVDELDAIEEVSPFKTSSNKAGVKRDRATAFFAVISDSDGDDSSVQEERKIPIGHRQLGPFFLTRNPTNPSIVRRMSSQTGANATAANQEEKHAPVMADRATTATEHKASEGKIIVIDSHNSVDVKKPNFLAAEDNDPLITTSININKNENIIAISEDGHHLPPLPASVEILEIETAAQPEQQVDCPSCLCTYPLSETYTFDCKCRKTMCRELCVERVLKMAIDERTQLRCPFCHEAIHHDEIVNLLDAEHPFAQEYGTLELQAYIRSNPAVFLHCPGKNCKGVVEVPKEYRHQRIRVLCHMCQQEYCSLCRQIPYHYNTTCAEANFVKAKWSSLVIELGAKGVSPEYVQEQKVKLANYKALKADEEHKAKTCVLCPKCTRPIERTGGCDQMVCGRDNEGGNIQNGCGHKFNWGKAKEHHRYVPHLPDPPEKGTSISSLQSNHENFEHPEYLPCEFCHKVIIGVRFECLNCPGELSVCSECFPKISTEHSKEHCFHIVKGATDAKWLRDHQRGEGIIDEPQPPEEEEDVPQPKTKVKKIVKGSKNKRKENAAPSQEVVVPGGSQPAAAPKRKNPFMAFSSEMRPEIMRQNPQWKVVEVGAELGRRWRALSEDEKEKYRNM